MKNVKQLTIQETQQIYGGGISGKQCLGAVEAGIIGGEWKAWCSGTIFGGAAGKSGGILVGATFGRAAAIDCIGSAELNLGNQLLWDVIE